MASPLPLSHLVIQRLSVPFEYTVAFTDGVFDPRNTTLLDAVRRREPDRRHRLWCVVDGGVSDAFPELRAQIERWAAAHAEAVTLVAPPELVPGGEEVKNDPALLGRLHARMAELRLDRHAFVVIVGGGSVLDAVGLASATAHRGVRTVRVPTTVLGQADSGVGVKNGVNAYGSKNFFGTFAPPWAVVNDARFLERLPAREQVAGLAEAVKVALIRDGAFFEWLEANAARLAACERDAVAYAVRRCAELHMRHIATGGDPFELGSARPLDHGHWSAHKLETLSGHTLRHGEAVSLGIRLDAWYAVRAGLLAEADARRIVALFERLGLPTWHEALDAREPDGTLRVLRGLEEFREHLGGELTVTLLRGIGHAEEVHEMDVAWVGEALERLRPRG